jgi:hypothetical protein
MYMRILFTVPTVVVAILFVTVSSVGAGLYWPLD